MKSKFSFLLLLLAGVFSFTFAQVEPDSIQLSSCKELHTKYKNNIGINWSDKNGSPDIITFSRPVAFEKSHKESSKEFLKELKGLLKYRSMKDTLVLIKTNENNGIKYFRYRQEYQGIPVKGGEYMVTVLEDGSIQTALGSFHKDIELDTNPQIPVNEALLSALENPPSKTGLKDSLYSYDLIIYPEDQLYYLAWELKIPGLADHGNWSYIIDASTGEVLHVNSNVIYENFNTLLLPQSETYAYERHPELDASYSYISPISNLNDNGYLQGTYAYILNDGGDEAYSSINSFLYSTSSAHFDEGNLYYHINRYRSNYINNFGFSSFTQITARANHYFSSGPNASYSLSDNQLRFSNGQGVTGYNSFAREDKIVYHEYTHAITDYIADLQPGYSESGAIHEGNSDYFPASFTGRTLLGEYSSPGHSINQRDLTDPRIEDYTEYHDPESYIVDDIDYGRYEPHFGGELWSACLWDLRSAISQYYADRLTYYGLSGIPTNSTFLQYRQKIIDEDIARYSGNHAQTIRHVFYLRGIGPDYLQTRVSGPSALDFKERGTYTANVTGGSGSVTYQWYRSDDGGSTWRSLGTSQTQVSTMVYDDFIMRCEVHDTQTAEDASGSCTVYYGYPPEKKNSAQNELTDEYKLYQNYPNPFNPATEIKYKIKNNGFISLKIYDPLGKEIAVLVKGFQNAGEYTVNFDAGSLPSGIYFYKIETAAFREVKKMMLLR